MKKRVWMNSLGIATAAGITLAPMWTSVAYAATSATYDMTKKTIVLNDKTVSQPYGFAHNQTMYMPIWYVETGLLQLGIKSTWKNNVWNLQVPSTMAVDTSNIQVGTGHIQLEINGKLMHKVDGIAAVDPASGKPTTFIPIWYTQQLLARLGITSPWNGSTWTLTTPSTVSSPPVLPTDEVPTWKLLQGVEASFGISATASGTSPYDDIAATDAHFATTATAIRDHLYTPPSSTHSGAYEAVSVATADQVLWNAFGITEAAYQPGGAPFAWANAVGLNPTGVQSTDLLTAQELAEMMSNLANQKAGFEKLGNNSYQIDYPIRDEAVATFSGDSAGGQPFFTSNQAVQTAIINTYQFFDNIQVTDENGTWELTMPGLAASSCFSYTTTLGQVSYELPGETTWSSTDVLDSRDLDLTGDETVKVLIPETSGITVSLNQMLPDFGGTVALGELQIGVANGALSVERIDISQ
ncbi:hypothetical protein NZD89_26375 [Alicyclobacillus fastidiosus]|uniref:Copper amine oxidase-like N-terminal domain-containing protein n=1 Tax=Alicyclobacillus fastidiosus TaxID=392011 RepID=A0ABY6ZFR0_9BACL|nr:hypothetical protein [Alicyclobacillus fastidiosus]WAH41694.1 hypothetical protein NZD89_26375 [Alicyclobacillus fastidiosus]